MLDVRNLSQTSKVFNWEWIILSSVPLSGLCDFRIRLSGFISMSEIAVGWTERCLEM